MNVIEVQPDSKKSLNGNLSVAPSNPADSVYPIGSLYLTLDKSSVCPLETLGYGKWERLPSNLCLQTASSVTNAGTQVEAGLPNIKGTFPGEDPSGGWGNFWKAVTGAFYKGDRGYGLGLGGINSNEPMVTLDASRSSPVYGRSNTVQPPAIMVNVWKRIA